MRLLRSQLFLDNLAALKGSDEDLFEVVAADIAYLLELKRKAELPQVRWGLAQSRYSDDMGEVRSHRPGDEAFVRTLFALPSDERVCAFFLIGDKNTGDGATGDEWYDKAIPLADEMWNQMLDSGEDSAG